MITPCDSHTTKTAWYTVAYLAIATPNTHPPTVDQKPIHPASTCVLEKKRREGYSVFNMQSVTVRTELDREQALSV